MNKLIEYCCKMNMSYSYKPVLIMALVEYGGEIHISDAVDYFVQYYARRLSLGLIAERTNSIYSNLNCSLEQIASNIKSNPVKALLNSDHFEYDKKQEILSIKSHVWEELTSSEKEKIIEICLNRLDEYYIKIVHLPEQEVICFHKPDEDNGYLSNWYQSEFLIHGECFSSVEPYMMYQKALQFNDYIARNRILRTDDVDEIKQIGRTVKNYNEKIWNGKRQLIVYQGLLSKFTQNETLKEKLLNTGSAMLAECSVSDKIWGIGISIKDDRRYLIDEWEGHNLLGFSLMQVRNILHETRSL